MGFSARESVLRNAEGADSPGLTAIAGGHVSSSDSLSLSQSVDIVGISNVQNDLGVGPG